MSLMPFGKSLSRSRPTPPAEGHSGRESVPDQEVGPVSAHRGEPGAARLQRRGHDRRGSERRYGPERRGNLVVAPATWIERFVRSMRGLGSEPMFWLVVVLVMTAAICWVLSVLRVAAWAFPIISTTVILGGSIATIRYQDYLRATAELHVMSLDMKHAHLERLFNAMQAKLKGVQAELDMAIADREDLRELIEERLRDSTEPSQAA